MWQRWWWMSEKQRCVMQLWFTSQIRHGRSRQDNYRLVTTNYQIRLPISWSSFGHIYLTKWFSEGHHRWYRMPRSQPFENPSRWVVATLDQEKREKVFWHNWGQEFAIEFDFAVLKNKDKYSLHSYSEHYNKESWTIGQHHNLDETTVFKEEF